MSGSNLLLWIFLITSPILAKPYWVFFKDKGDVKSGTTYYSALPRKTRLRRAKMGIVTGGTWDIPVYQPYLDHITRLGGRLRAVSKWLNAASFELDELDSATIVALPYVLRVEPIRRATRPLPEVEGIHPTIEDNLYGESWEYLKRMGIVNMHELGYHGEGVRLAFLDTGCRLSHQAFDSANIVATWDFINNDPEVANEPADDYNQDIHGTYTSSVVAGFIPGRLIGVAYKAEFLIIKTERVDTEIVMEEDFWVRGIEWAESLGADIVSSSLAYNDWYSREDMDGHTARTTIAANRAASLGVLVVNAAGNDRGNDWNYISAPADAESVITVGALDKLERVASFSSPGPTYDGRLKPELTAFGVHVPAVNPSVSDGIVYVSGTSMATPLVSGAAALLLQALPELTPMELKNLLCQWADQYFAPDTNVGYGMPNPFLSAVKPTALYLELIDGETNLPMDTTSFTLEAGDTIYEGRTNARGIAVIYPLLPMSYTLSIEYAPGRFFRKNIDLTEGKHHRRIRVERREKEAITIYPNPFSDSLTLLLSEEPDDISRVELYTSSGHLLKEEEFIGSSKTLSFPQLANGVYILVISVDGERYIRKVARISR